MKAKILVGSPIRQKPAILHEFLSSLDRLEQNTFEMNFFFIDDNDQKESKILLKDFAINKKERCFLQEPQLLNGSQYICNETTHFWKDSMIWKVAAYKDGIIQHAKAKGYDGLFLIDSDLVLHPRTIDQLIESQKEIISNIFWTKWQPDQISLPQVWLFDHYTLFDHKCHEQLSNEEMVRRQKVFLDKLKKPGVYEVGGLGACTLIQKSALQKEISFQRIKNVSFWGEDRHFCIRAVAIGLSLHVDTHYPAYHIYRDSDLSGVEEFKKKHV